MKDLIQLEKGKDEKIIETMKLCVAKHVENNIETREELARKTREGINTLEK